MVIFSVLLHVGHNFELVSKNELLKKKQQMPVMVQTKWGSILSVLFMIPSGKLVNE